MDSDVGNILATSGNDYRFTVHVTDVQSESHPRSNVISKFISFFRFNFSVTDLNSVRLMTVLNDCINAVAKFPSHRFRILISKKFHEGNKSFGLKITPEKNRIQHI